MDVSGNIEDVGIDPCGRSRGWLRPYRRIAKYIRAIADEK